MALDGLAKLLQNLKALDQRVTAAAVRAVDDVGEQVMADSKAIVPLSPTNATIIGKRGKPIKNPLYQGAQGRRQGGSGTLFRSGTSTPAEIIGKRIVKVVKYTDSIAAAVHERPARHGRALQAAFPQAHIPNLDAHWKFLAIPLMRRRRSGMVYIADEIRRAIHG